jgi:hypothetical protein
MKRYIVTKTRKNSENWFFKLMFHPTQNIWYELDDFPAPKVRDMTKHRHSLEDLTVK